MAPGSVFGLYSQSSDIFKVSRYATASLGLINRWISKLVQGGQSAEVGEDEYKGDTVLVLSSKKLYSCPLQPTCLSLLMNP